MEEGAAAPQLFSASPSPLSPRPGNTTETGQKDLSLPPLLPPCPGVLKDALGLPPVALLLFFTPPPEDGFRHPVGKLPLRFLLKPHAEVWGLML